MSAFLIASALQGFFILYDEFFFHHKRGLPKWERIGHPIDTATVITCLMFLYFTHPGPVTTPIYWAMAVGSCLCVTKDEWVHWKYCGPAEMWLHAVLFMLHPVILFAAMFEWESQKQGFLMVSGAVFVFFVYQVVYWNFLDSKIRQAKQKAHYKSLSQEDLYEYFGE